MTKIFKACSPLQNYQPYTPVKVTNWDNECHYQPDHSSKLECYNAPKWSGRHTVFTPFFLPAFYLAFFSKTVYWIFMNFTKTNFGWSRCAICYMYFDHVHDWKNMDFPVGVSFGDMTSLFSYNLFSLSWDDQFHTLYYLYYSVSTCIHILVFFIAC